MTRRGDNRRRRSLLWGAGAAVVLGAALAGLLAGNAEPVTLHVRNARQFEEAVAQLRSSGGRVVLLAHGYRRELVVGPRSDRPLRIVGRPGARVGRVLLDRTQQVELGSVTVRPQGEDAWIRVRRSDRVDLHDLVVTADGTDRSASV